MGEKAEEKASRLDGPQWIRAFPPPQKHMEEARSNTLRLQDRLHGREGTTAKTSMTYREDMSAHTAMTASSPTTKNGLSGGEVLPFHVSGRFAEKSVMALASLFVEHILLTS